MKRVAVVFFFVSFLLVFPGSDEAAKGEQGKGGGTVNVGSFSIKAPAGEDWETQVDKDAGRVQFQRVRGLPHDSLKTASSTSIQVMRKGTGTDEWDLSEKQVAENYLNNEEKRVRDTLVKETGHELSDVNREVTTIGKKKVYTLSYRATKPELTVEAIVYLYFPDDYRKNHVYYVFFFSDAYMKEFHKPDVKEIHPVIASLSIVKRDFPKEVLHKELLKAIDENKISNVRELLDRGADLNRKDSEGWSPLMVAAIKGNNEIVKLLVERGAKVNERNPKGQTPLLFATHWGHADVVKTLIEKGADINVQMSDGWTPLIDAIQMDKAQIAKMLLNKGADVNRKSNIGWTALMAAAYTNQAEIVKLLIEKGAYLQARDDAGKNALQVAKSRGHAEIVRILTEAGASE